MKSVSRRIDIGFITLCIELLVLVFIVFLWGRESDSILSFVMIGTSFISMIITYICGIVVGLISTSIIIFLYALYVFYNSLVYGVEISYITYIWMIMIGIINFTVGKLSQNINDLQFINKKLQDEFEDLVSIDKDTGLRNIKHFYTYLDKEISRSRRYKNNLSLMIIKFPYSNDLIRIMGEKNYNEVIKEVGNIITESIRIEDDIYSLNNDMLAIIIPNTDLKGASFIKDRIRDKVDKLNLKNKDYRKNTAIDLKIAIHEYDENIKNAIMYKQICEAELEYDV